MELLRRGELCPLIYAPAAAVSITGSLEPGSFNLMEAI